MTNHTDGPATPETFEVIPDQEEAWRQEISAMTVKLQEKRKGLQDDEVLRGVHPKSHGCLDAEFLVNKDIPESLRVGLFAQPDRCFRAKIRYSNADVLKRADIDADESSGAKVMKHGSRGMAIKVLDVDGPVLLEDSDRKNQDFLMVNTPEFAFRNVRDYRRLTAALLASENGAKPDFFFIPAVMLSLGMMDGHGKVAPASPDDTDEMKRLRAGFENLDFVFSGYNDEDVQGVLNARAIVEKIQATSVRNPLNANYFGAAPFRFGSDRVMRFSVTPLGDGTPEEDLDQEEMKSLHVDYLSHALSAAIAKNETIKLSFWLQIANACDIKGKEVTMIENASVPWDPVKFEPVEVAQIVIYPNQAATLVDACKQELFTPWHALEAHEPLGGINRLRKPVYSASAEFRRAT